MSKVRIFISMHRKWMGACSAFRKGDEKGADRHQGRCGGERTSRTTGSKRGIDASGHKSLYLRLSSREGPGGTDRFSGKTRVSGIDF